MEARVSLQADSAEWGREALLHRMVLEECLRVVLEECPQEEDRLRDLAAARVSPVETEDRAGEDFKGPSRKTSRIR